MGSVPTRSNTDLSARPSKTNILTTIGQTRPDRVAHVSPYAAHPTTGQWLNPNAFQIKDLAANYGTQNQIGIGRFGNAPVGGVVGPGTVNFSL